MGSRLTVSPNLTSWQVFGAEKYLIQPFKSSSLLIRFAVSMRTAGMGAPEPHFGPVVQDEELQRWQGNSSVKSPAGQASKKKN